MKSMMLAKICPTFTYTYYQRQSITFSSGGTDVIWDSEHQIQYTKRSDPWQSAMAISVSAQVTLVSSPWLITLRFLVVC